MHFENFQQLREALRHPRSNRPGQIHFQAQFNIQSVILHTQLPGDYNKKLPNTIINEHLAPLSSIRLLNASETFNRGVDLVRHHASSDSRHSRHSTRSELSAP